MTENLKESTLWAVLWSVLRVGWTNLAAFAMFAILARILGPNEFGLYALAAAVLDILRVLVNAGMSDAIQREKDLTDATATTAFWSGLWISLLLVAVTACLAIPYAKLMHSPELAKLLIILSLVLPIIALGNVHVARTLREYGHKYIAIRALAAGSVAGVVAIVTAMLGAGVWALVVQVMIVEIIGTVVAWWAFPWKPRFYMDSKSIRPLFAFGGGMMVTQLLWATLSRVPEFFIGRVLGLDAVGGYRVAWRMFDLIGQSILQPMGSVALVTLARLQDNSDGFRRAYRRILGLGALTALPLITGFGAVAGDVVPLLFGDKWKLSGLIASIVAISAFPFTLNYFFAPALAARGQSKALSSIAFVQLLGTVLLAWASVRFGLVALTWAVVARAYLTMPYIQQKLHRVAGITRVDGIDPVIAPFLCSAGMALIVLSAQQTIFNGFSYRWERVLSSCALGAFLYPALFVLFARASLKSHFGVLLPLLKSKINLGKK